MNDWNGIKEFLVDKIRFNKSWKSIISKITDTFWCREAAIFLVQLILQSSGESTPSLLP